MTQDEIIAMAKEAGFGTHMDLMDDPHMQSHAQRFFQKLDSFAALVAEKEREACASHLEDCYPPIGMHGNRIEIGAVARTCYADSIRARGQKEGA